VTLLRCAATLLSDTTALCRHIIHCTANVLNNRNLKNFALDQIIIKYGLYSLFQKGYKSTLHRDTGIEYVETTTEDMDRTELVTIFREESESKQCCDSFDNITLLLGHTQFCLKIGPVMYWY